jgi:hypothetical protein
LLPNFSPAFLKIQDMPNLRRSLRATSEPKQTNSRGHSASQHDAEFFFLKTIKMMPIQMQIKTPIMVPMMMQLKTPSKMMRRTIYQWMHCSNWHKNQVLQPVCPPRERNYFKMV